MSEKEKKPRKRNPFRGLIKKMIGQHTTNVAEGAITPEKVIRKEIELANGMKFEIAVRRTAPANTTVRGAWDFPPKRKSVAA